MAMKNKYSMLIRWSEGDGGFIATSPEFPGLSAFGKTRDIAVRECAVAMAGMVDAYYEEREEIPEPDIIPPSVMGG